MRLGDLLAKHPSVTMQPDSAESGVILLVAGKGHEDYQIVVELDPSGRPICDSRGRPVTKKIPFSDATIIREIAASL